MAARKGSLKRKVASEHRRLDRLFAEVRATLMPSGPKAKRLPLFGRLRETLEAHLAQEDRLYYPPIWALRPERKAALLALVRAHDQFRSLLDEIGRDLAEGAMGAARRAFDSFAEAFAQHEAGEEKLLHALEEEIGPADAAR
jgi:hypothetical protein